MAAAAPKVSVLMLAYNHESFIAQALDSILMQQVTFEYEIVVGEDCSTDRTLAILRDYQNRYPFIHVLDPERNLGPGANFARTWAACRGQYIAVLDGDDFWTDASKLQIQVDFLDSHPEFSIHCHRFSVLARAGSLAEVSPDITAEGVLDLKEFRYSDPVGAVSLMFRAGIVQEIPQWMVPSVLCDWPLIILHGLRGPIWHSNRVMGTYRYHGGGVWTGGDPMKKAQTVLYVFTELERHLQPEFQTVARFGRFTAMQRIVEAAVTTRRRRTALTYAGRVFTIGKLPGAFRAKVIVLLRAVLPNGVFCRLAHYFGRKGL